MQPAQTYFTGSAVGSGTIGIANGPSLTNTYPQEGTQLKRQPEVHSEFDRMVGNISALESLTDNLEKRLSESVLGPAAPATETRLTSEVRAARLSQLGSNLQENTARLSRLSERLADLLQRLEV